MRLSGKIKRRIYKQKSKLVLSVATVMATIMLTGQVFAMPAEGNVISGAININDLAKIAVGTNGIIEWNKFNIGTGEAVNFNFTGSANGVLNRVTGGNISSIQGLLSSTGNNGTVMLVNPAGIIFGAGAQINVPTFIASTIDAKNSDFLNMMKNGSMTTFSAGTVKGKIEVNGNLSLGNRTSFIGVGNSINIAPGISITAAGVDSGISFYAGNSMTTLSKIGENERPYTNFSGLTTNSENVITVGAGSELSADAITLLGNSVNINGTTDKMVKIISLGNDRDADTVIGAFNNITLSYDASSGLSTRTMNATSANTININNADIGMVSNFPGENPNSPNIELVGGKVTIADSGLNFGGMQWNGNTNTIGNSTYIIAGNNIKLTKDDATGLYTKLAWKATPDNTINITSSDIYASTPQEGGSILERNRLALLGGQVNVVDSEIAVGEFFVGAGTSMSLEKSTDASDPQAQYWDEYYFSNTAGATTNGSTVSFDKNTIISASGEAAVDANSITTNGEITATGAFGIHLTAFDKYNTANDNNNNVDGTLEVSKNNTIINNGRINANEQLEVSGTHFVNNGIITLGDGGEYTIVLADQMTGNPLQNTNPKQSSAIIQGKDDKQYDATKPFNRITGTMTGTDEPKTMSWSFATSSSRGDDTINSNSSLDEKKSKIAQIAGNLTNDADAATLVNDIAAVSDQTVKTELLETMLNSYEPTQSALTQSTGQINSSASSSPAVTTSIIAPTQITMTSTTGIPTVASDVSDAVVTIVPASTNTKEDQTK